VRNSFKAFSVPWAGKGKPTHRIQNVGKTFANMGLSYSFTSLSTISGGC
jgi:hypothetical protein